jgi:hypothetical protein
MLAENWRTINPASGAAVVVMWLAGGTILGGACGWLGGRGLSLFRVSPGDGAAFFSAFVAGHFFAPPLVGPAAGILLPGLRWLRRRLLPRHGRLDAGIPLAIAAGVGAFLLDADRVLAPDLPAGGTLVAGTPLPGSIPVTISVHRQASFPSVPAVHVPLRPLATEPIGARAALWSGRAPARTRPGRGVPRRLLGGGGLSRFPDRPAVDVLTSILPSAAESDAAFQTRGTLTEIVAASGIPVLRAPPTPDDPALFLRILDEQNPPGEDEAHQLRETGAWIDVTLAPGRHLEIALAGEGVAVAPAQEPATLMDVAPTALHLLGLAVPRETDGRVLLELLDARGPGGRQPRYRNLEVRDPEGT